VALGHCVQASGSGQRRLSAIRSLGELTGGRSFDPPTMNSDILKRITGALVGPIMTEYIAGFTLEISSGKQGKNIR